MSRIFCLAIPLLLAAGCGGSAPTEPAPAVAPAVDEALVDRAVAIGKAIKADPTHVDAVLSANQISRADFEALLFKISEDPALAALYVKKRAP